MNARTYCRFRCFVVLVANVRTSLDKFTTQWTKFMLIAYAVYKLSWIFSSFCVCVCVLCTFIVPQLRRVVIPNVNIHSAQRKVSSPMSYAFTDNVIKSLRFVIFSMKHTLNTSQTKQISTRLPLPWKCICQRQYVVCIYALLLLTIDRCVKVITWCA